MDEFERLRDASSECSKHATISITARSRVTDVVVVVGLGLCSENGGVVTRPGSLLRNEFGYIVLLYLC